MYSQIFKDDVIKQEPKANKEFCKIVQELAQKNSEMPPPSSAISELLERSALLELRLRSWGLWTAYQLNHLKKDENYVTEGHHDVEFIAAPLKKVDRIVEKLALLNPASSPANKCPLKDAARGAIACKSIGLMLVVLQVVQREVQQNILLLLQVKDRWSHGKSAYGWSDVVLILAFPDGLGANVPFELQITHSKLFNTLFSRGPRGLLPVLRVGHAGRLLVLRVGHAGSSPSLSLSLSLSLFLSPSVAFLCRCSLPFPRLF